MNGQEYYQYLEQMNPAPNNKEKILILLDQIIEHEKQVDRRHKAAAIVNHKASQSLGEGFTLFHLKALKELIDNGDV
mgnify:FL=1|tara:strand:- start:165 stop:395 length:231 start_codon:yes stop_codon:yes gene_type:complete